MEPNEINVHPNEQEMEWINSQDGNDKPDVAEIVEVNYDDDSE